jgi:hypothetical protein
MATTVGEDKKDERDAQIDAQKEDVIKEDLVIHFQLH